MSLSRIGFPFSVSEGRLSFSVDAQAAQEAISALVRTHTGELPLSRDYGADLEYNIQPEMATYHVQQISQRLSEYHPHLTLQRVSPVLSEQGTVLDWEINVEVQAGV